MSALLFKLCDATHKASSSVVPTFWIEDYLKTVPEDYDTRETLGARLTIVSERQGTRGLELLVGSDEDERYSWIDWDRAEDLFHAVVLESWSELSSEAKHQRLLDAQESSSLVHKVQTAVRLVFPGELAKHAVSEGTKAVTKFTYSRDSTGPACTKAGLQFHVGHVALKMTHYLNRAVSASAAVYMTAVLEYTSAEILELSGNRARDNYRELISPRDITLAILNDEELNNLFQGYHILGGGVQPCLHTVLVKDTDQEFPPFEKEFPEWNPQFEDQEDLFSSFISSRPTADTLDTYTVDLKDLEAVPPEELVGPGIARDRDRTEQVDESQPSSGGRRRYTKLLRDNIQVLTRPFFEVLFARAGIKCASRLVYEELRHCSKVFLENVLREAVTLCEHECRRIVSIEHILKGYSVHFGHACGTGYIYTISAREEAGFPSADVDWHEVARKERSQEYRDPAAYAQSEAQARSSCEPLILVLADGEECPLYGWAAVSWDNGTIRHLAAAQYPEKFADGVPNLMVGSASDGKLPTNSERHRLVELGPQNADERKLFVAPLSAVAPPLAPPPTDMNLAYDEDVGSNWFSFRTLNEFDKMNETDGRGREEDEPEEAEAPCTSKRGWLEKNAIQMIRAEQRAVPRPAVPFIPFSRLTMEIIQDYKTDMKITPIAVRLLHDLLTEAYLVPLLQNSMLLAIHHQAMSIAPRNLQLANRILKARC